MGYPTTTIISTTYYKINNYTKQRVDSSVQMAFSELFFLFHCLLFALRFFSVWKDLKLKNQSFDDNSAFIQSVSILIDDNTIILKVIWVSAILFLKQNFILNIKKVIFKPINGLKLEKNEINLDKFLKFKSSLKKRRAL